MCMSVYTCSYIYIKLYSHIFYILIYTCITSCTYSTTSNTVLLLLVYCIIFFVCTCSGGPRHKPFGVSTGSPLSQ